MHNPAEEQPSAEELQEFASVLKQLQPAVSEVDERELFYQLGLSAQCDLHGGNDKSISVSSLPRFKSWHLFGSGIATGIAAAWLVMVSLGNLGGSREVPVVPRGSDVAAVEGIKPNPAAVEPIPSKSRSPAITNDMAFDVEELLYRENTYSSSRIIIGRASLPARMVSSRGDTIEPVERTPVVDNLGWRRTPGESFEDFFD